MAINPCIEFIAPFRIYLPEDFFEVTLGESISLVKPIALPPIQAAGTEARGKNIEVSHDVFGYAGRTQFTVVIDEEIDSNSDNWKKIFFDNESKFVDLALLPVNRMLEVYRDQDKNNLNEKSFHITTLVKTDIHDIRLIAVDEDLKEIEGLLVRKSSFHQVELGTTQRKHEIVAEIRKLLKDGSPIPIYRQLMNSALNHIWRGQYSLVPIEANTAFESFIPEIIHLLDPCVNISELKDFCAKLMRLEGILATALNKANKNTVSWFTKPPNGWKTLMQKEFQKWYDDCYCITNNIIHDGYNNVNQEEALKAYEASLSAINYVQAEIAKTIII